jgi:hypothetical protein
MNRANQATIFLFAHQAQQVYYLSYPHERMENWWVVYKVNPEMDTHRCDEYVERHEDDDVVHVYQEEIEGHQSFTVSDGAGLVELATHDIELMQEEPGPSKKHLQKSKHVIERQERRERLDDVSLKQIQMLTTFDKYKLLLL